MTPARPDKVNILGVGYTIEYVEKPSDVDIYKRASLWGQVDYWTRTIRLYDNQTTIEDIWQTLLHEILHAVAESLHLKLKNDDRHDELDLIALALADVLFRNKWIVLQE